MELTTHAGNFLELEADALVIGVPATLELGTSAQQVNQATDGLLEKLMQLGEVDGKHLACTTVLAPRGMTAQRLIILGLGDELDRGGAFAVAGAALKSVSDKSRERVVIALDAITETEAREDAVAGAIAATEGQDLYRAQKKRYAPAEITWCGLTEAEVARGRVKGQAINLTRRLVNRPAHDIYPETFANEAAAMASANQLQCTVWDEVRLAEERCQALLAVAQGSSRAPRLVICRHDGGGADAPTLALVGKGVTFDSGGLSLKPSEGMKAMKCDMAGAATVLGAMQAIAQLNLPVNVIGLMGLVENMVSGSSYKLGDVLTSRSGKTIEVLNTDAEGRLVLADTLDVAVEMGADKIVDLATLTGACVVALGNDVCGLMTNHADWGSTVLAAANSCGEDTWELPMFPAYGEQIRSEVADIKNVGDGRWGGAITAGKFLEEFVRDVPWVHLDIAGPAFRDKPKPWMDAGASGQMVRTLIELVQREAS